MVDVRSMKFDAALPGDIPDSYTLLLTNPSGDTPSSSDTPPKNWIVLPSGGQLWVGYEYGIGDPPATLVEIWHEADGTTETVPPGLNNQFTVEQNDALIYQLEYMYQPIKLGWAYV